MKRADEIKILTAKERFESEIEEIIEDEARHGLNSFVFRDTEYFLIVKYLANAENQQRLRDLGYGVEFVPGYAKGKSYWVPTQCTITWSK